MASEVVKALCFLEIYFLGEAVLFVDEMTQEARLKQDLLGHYERKVRPIYNGSLPINVTMELVLHQIIGVVSNNLNGSKLSRSPL
mgnify:CR=1 FL=1